MDFGAGTGLICPQTAAHVEKITAVDISQALLEKLGAKPALQNKVEIAGYEPVPNHRFVTLLSEPFDCCSCVVQVGWVAVRHH